MQTHGDSLGDDARAFLNHYLRLIGSRFMDDPKIDELCQTIYKNHRAAIDLIVERVAAGRGVVGEIERLIREDSRWHVVGSGESKVYFIPADWIDFMPPIAKQKSYNPRHWFLLSVGVNTKKLRCGSAIQVRPATEQALRNQVIKRIASDPAEFGVTTFFKNLDNIGQNWARMGKRGIGKLEDLAGLDGKTRDALQAELDYREGQMRQIKTALTPLIEQWKSQQEAS